MLAVVMALALAGASCTSGKGKADPPPLPTTTSTTGGTTSTTIDTTRAAILAAYRAEWSEFIAVAETFPVNPLDPRLAIHSIGNQLTAERKALTRLSVLGHVNRGPTDLAPVVSTVSASGATVTDCIMDHSVEVDHRTNSPVEPANIGHTLDQFTMTNVDGNWLVSNSMVLGSGKTKDACVPSQS
jgi:hypothetical protein